MDSKLPVDADAGKTLTDVLGQAEHVKGLVEQSAQELSSVNTGLAQEMAHSRESPGVRVALEKSQAVEHKVQEASEKLSEVNLALEAEVTARHVLEAQLATVTQDAQAARHAALHDALTGLPNRHKRTLAVMFLDLDGFKRCMVTTLVTRCSSAPQNGSNNTPVVTTPSAVSVVTSSCIC